MCFGIVDTTKRHFSGKMVIEEIEVLKFSSLHNLYYNSLQERKSMKKGLWMNFHKPFHIIRFKMVAGAEPVTHVKQGYLFHGEPGVFNVRLDSTFSGRLAYQVDLRRPLL